jgi:pimeloyl-ACP methyl ester carboxylesterase
MSLPTTSPWDEARYYRHLQRVLERAQLHVTQVVLPTSRHVLVDRMRLHYLEWGRPDAAPLLLLHGGGLNAHTWDVVALALSDRYRCIALDLRGHGESEWSRSLEYTVATHTADVRAFLDVVGIDRCVVIGMSLGGIVSMSLTLTAPDVVRGLVLVDVGPAPRTEGVRRIEGFMNATTSFDTIEDAVDRAIGFNPRRDPNLLTWTLERNLMRLHNGPYTWKYDRRHRATSEHVDEIVADNIRLAERVGEINCPVLLAYGEQSDVVSPDDADRFVARIRDGRAVGVPNAGHTVQGDNPGALLALLDEFIPGLPD